MGFSVEIQLCRDISEILQSSTEKSKFAFKQPIYDCNCLKICIFQDEDILDFYLQFQFFIVTFVKKISTENTFIITLEMSYFNSMICDKYSNNIGHLKNMILFNQVMGTRVKNFNFNFKSKSIEATDREKFSLSNFLFLKI